MSAFPIAYTFHPQSKPSQELSTSPESNSSVSNLNAVKVHIPNLSASPNSSLDTKTMEAAKNAFGHIAEQIQSLPSCKLLPYSHDFVESSASSSAPSLEDHWTEHLDPLQERERVEKPSMSAVLRICFLSTFDRENKIEKVPFTEQDLAAFVLSKKTRDRTYTWFYAGMIPFALLSGVQGFASLMWPSSPIGQGVVIAAAGTTVAALGILFTGFNPDYSQDCLNEKVDKLNRVKRELDEVARSLISFCFYKEAPVRKLAQIAAEEINLELIEQAATVSQKYAITKQDIAPSLELLSQSIAYIRLRKPPENPELNNLLSSCLKRMDELKKCGEWKEA